MQVWFMRMKGWLSTIALVLSVMGIVTFSLFIFEESLQIVTFGTWPAADAGRYDLVLEGIDLMENTNSWMKAINYSVGWIQPIAFLSYRAYGKSTDFYIKALKAKSFARDPKAFIGRRVEIVFVPMTAEVKDDVVHYVNRLVEVVAKGPPLPLQAMVVEGVVKARTGEHITIVAESIKIKTVF